MVDVRIILDPIVGLAYKSSGATWDPNPDDGSNPEDDDTDDDDDDDEPNNLPHIYIYIFIFYSFITIYTAVSKQ